MVDPKQLLTMDDVEDGAGDKRTTKLLDLIPKETISRWDGWDWRINSPVLLSNPPEVIVYLKNEDGSEIKVDFGLQEGVETTIL